MKISHLVLFVVLASVSSAAPITYFTTLSGGAEAPPNGSMGTGTGTFDIDLSAHTLSVNFTFSGLLSPTTVAHIHCCTSVAGTGTAGVATATPSFPGFPSGATSGSYSRTFDTTLNSTWNASFIAANGGTASGAEAAFAAGLASGRSYLNVHTSQFPAGEIRGFLQPVPEPSTLALVGIALAALGIRARRRA